MKISTTTVGASLITLLLASTNVNACEFHGQGTGFGMFGPNNPMMSQHFKNQSSQQLKLVHERRIVVKQSAEESIEIKYHVPVAYDNASLRFTYSDGIEIPNNGEKIEINKLNGTYTLNYIAKTSGRQHILVWADAHKQNLPFSKVQRIDLTVE